MWIGCWTRIGWDVERVTRQLGMHAGGPGYERGSQPPVGVGSCEPTDGRDGGEGSVSRLLAQKGSSLLRSEMSLW